VDDAPSPRPRLVLIGASNMTRGFAVLCQLARRSFGEPVDIAAAIGHGRSYGLTSNVLGRRLPSVLACGLWPVLDAASPASTTTAVVGDVGNDILYGIPVPEILGWVDETLRRLKARSARLILTSLPAPAHSLSRVHFEIFRTVFFPARKLRYEQVRPMVAALEDGLRALAGTHRARYVELKPEWYGFDPIHIRPGKCRRAWQEFVGDGAVACPRVGIARSLATYRLFPERQWMFGHEMRRTQPCWRLATGSTVSLY
jgi:hypothetical protein